MLWRASSFILALSLGLLALGQAVRPPVSPGTQAVPVVQPAAPTTQPSTQPTLGQQVDATIAAQAAAITLLKSQLDARNFTLFYPLPDDENFLVAKQYHVDGSVVSGDAMGNGSTTQPYTTVARALQQVWNDRISGAIPPASITEQAEILYAGHQKYEQDNSPNFAAYDFLVFSSYHGIPEIDSTGTPFLKLPNSALNAGLYIDHLDLVHKGPTTQMSYGFMVNQVNHVGAQYCSFSGFTFNFACVQSSDDVLYAFNYNERSVGLSDSESGSNVFCANCTHVRHYGNFDYHAAWLDAVYTPAWWALVLTGDPTADALLNQLYFYHGEYWRDDNTWLPVDFSDDIFVGSASGGLQVRTSGTVTRCAFVHNGAAGDTFGVGPSISYDQIALIGETPGDGSLPDQWGQGIDLDAVESTATNVYVSNGSPLVQNPIVHVQAPVMGAVTGGTPLATTRPVPTTQALVDNVQGVWPVNNPTLFPAPGAVAVDAVVAPTTVVLNVNVRAPRLGEKVLTLPMIYSKATGLNLVTDDDVAKQFKLHFREQKTDPRWTAQYVIAATKAWIAANP